MKYDEFFKLALIKIKTYQNSDTLKIKQEQINSYKEDAFLHFREKEFDEYEQITQYAAKATIDCLKSIILENIDINSLDIEQIFVYNSSSQNHFVLRDKTNKILYLFKDLEEPWLDKRKSDNDEILDLFEAHECNGYYYVYFTYDNISSNKRHDGENFAYFPKNEEISIFRFFEVYFGKDATSNLLSELNKYLQSIQEHVNFVALQTLSPSTLLSFRRIVEYEIRSFPYHNLLKDTIPQNDSINLNQEDFDKILEQYITQSRFRILLGKKDHSESLITAEWLNKSFKLAQSLDLTVIGMGYFKAIEQLLSEIICLRMDIVNRDLTCGDMATIFKNNLSKILRNDISNKSKKFIREKIYHFCNLRNGYFHKENIHDSSVIEQIRTATFDIAYLLLGACKLTEYHAKILGIPDKKFYDDYYRLCEFVNYNYLSFFLIYSTREDVDQEDGVLVQALPDYDSKIIDNIFTSYSGAYFTLVNAQSTLVINRENLPFRIAIGKMGPFKADLSLRSFGWDVEFNVVFENGKFIGPPILTEYFDYKTLR